MDTLERWPKDRWDELKELESMLYELGSINNGSGAIERLQSCIAIAKKLTRTDYHAHRESFMMYVENQANPLPPEAAYVMSADPVPVLVSDSREATDGTSSN